jgi:hypothetical protein
MVQDEIYEMFKQKYPLCFEQEGCCMDFGLSHESGWNDILDQLFSKIEKHLSENDHLRDPDMGFRVDQVKEKFGTLRIYVTTMDNQIIDWVREAEKASEITCEVCGNEGFLHKKGIWLKTLCPHCAEKMEYEV